MRVNISAICGAGCSRERERASAKRTFRDTLRYLPRNERRSSRTRRSPGGAAKVTITCYVDETTLPAEFGPVLDLDGNGGLATTDCSATYKLLPVELIVTYVDRGFVETRQVHLLIGEKG